MGIYLALAGGSSRIYAVCRAAVPEKEGSLQYPAQGKSRPSRKAASISGAALSPWLGSKTACDAPDHSSETCMSMPGKPAVSGTPAILNMKNSVP